ncbi:MAG: hypothetical protein HQL33_11505, partial [Alphaproteobacteria bacterium]|nr:hypothetical protein [Alphaproteobacteria bacterium]
TYHAVLKTFVAPDDIPDSEVLEKAIREFCDWAHVSRWNDIANGYEFSQGMDDRRGRERDVRSPDRPPIFTH